MALDPLDEAISRLIEAEGQLVYLAGIERDEKRKQHLRDIATDVRKSREIVESQK